jgi:diaminohydroxyphosphoribosylaminopyrimidine deaminase/5-amino-6-(5-phosphoribosylamino)uracil reductase
MTHAGPGSERDARWMQRALELARRGRTAPNPRVGAVVIDDAGECVGEGFHERAGTPHAEVHALSRAGDRTRGATLYCTLEPCNHHGRTPPCTEAILAAGIRRVVIGCPDPKRHGTAAGAEHLRAHGVEVVLGIEEEAARELVADFATVALLGRPLVELKAAVTLDGRIATRTGDSKWITGEAARTEAHRLRAGADAVMVGVGTALEDDPRLDVRLPPDEPLPDPIGAPPRPPRIIVDSTLRIPLEAQVVRSARQHPTWIAHAPSADPARRAALAEAGVVPIEIPRAGGGGLDLAALLAELARRDVLRLLVEGGGRLHGALLDAGLVDRAAIFVAPVILGDPGAPGLATRAAPPTAIASALRLERVTVHTHGVDTLVRGHLRTTTW